MDSVWFTVLAGSQSDAFYGATCYSSVDCILAGRGTIDGVVVVTHNRGTSWTRKTFSSSPLTDITSNTVNGVVAILAVASGKIYHSSDSSTWTSATVTGALYSVALGSNGNFLFST